MEPPIVVALGGNAISRRGEEGNVEQQFARTRESCVHLAYLIGEGRRLVVTHGNGPQVGNILRRVELSAGEVYPIPLYLCVADTQAGMGMMITQCLDNALEKQGIDRHARTIITKVEVDPQDPAFNDPTKPIGRYLAKDRADELSRTYGWKMKAFQKGEFRRVVPSPQPLRILEIDLIRDLVEQGEILVVAGGGGVPVTHEDTLGWRGVDCVLDKDLTSAKLAAEIGAETLLIATSVDHVMLDYQTPDQRPLSELTIDEASAYLRAGQFGVGTMAPKVQAAVQFLQQTLASNPTALITRLELMREALAGTAGTRIRP